MSKRFTTSRGRSYVALLLAGMLGVIGVARAGVEDRIVSLEGEVVAAKISGIDSAGRVQGEGLKSPVELSSLREIQRDAATASARIAPLKLLLVGGGSLPVERCQLQDEQAVFDWAFGKQVKLPLDLIRGLQLLADKDAASRPVGAEALDKAVASATQDKDQLFLLVDGHLQTIAGLFEELTAEHVVFQWQDKQQKFPRGKVYGLAIAPVGKPPERAGQCEFSLTGGTSFWGRLEKLDAGQLSLELAKGASVDVPWDAVTKIAVRNSRLAFLSDLQPLEVVQESLLVSPQPWQRDRSVAGHPLTLAGRTFSKGLGVHSRCVLTFACDGFDSLAATIGIDAETRGQGVCLFIVSADGREVLRQPMRGSDPPKPIQVELTGTKKITLAVEPGEGLDLADHADWADARLIKTSAKSAGEKQK